MVSLKEKIYAEMENIEKSLVEIKKVKDRSDKEKIVIIGIGACLHSIYTGMENILKQLLIHKKIKIPDINTWHKDLINLSIEQNFITKKLADKIKNYLFFRHFFRHAYGFLIDEKELNPLMSNIFDVYSNFKKEINDYLIEI